MCELYFSLRGEKQRDLMKRRFGILARLVQLKRFFLVFTSGGMFSLVQLKRFF